MAAYYKIYNPWISDDGMELPRKSPFHIEYSDTFNNDSDYDWIEDMYRTNKKTVYKEKIPKKNTFIENNSKRNTEPTMSAIRSAEPDEVIRVTADASGVERKLTSEQVDYVTEKISEEELNKASKIFVTELKRRFIGSGKVVSIADAMKIAAVSFKVGFKYADGEDLKQIMK